MEFEIWQPYFISAVVGLLVGMEREKSHPHGNPIGVRTFLLMAVLGAVAGGIEQIWLAFLLSTFALALVACAYLLQGIGSAADRGLTTEIAAGVVFSLSYLSHSRPVLTSLLGPLVALVLVSKSSLHRFTRKIKSSELQAALLLFLIASTVVSLLEDKVIDPWGIFNPKKFGLIVLILGALQFLSYVLSKFVNDRQSAVLLGFLGGFVSSTAIILSVARESRASITNPVPSYLAVLSSQLAALVQVLFIAAWISPQLAWALALPLAGAIAVLIAALALFAIRGSRVRSQIPIRSPLDWQGVVRLAVLFATMLGAVELTNRALGQSAATALSMLTGIFELHGITLANATMFSLQRLDLNATVSNILYATTASLAAKSAISIAVARNRFAFTITLILATAAILLWIA